MVDICPSSLGLGAQDQLPNFQEPMNNKSAGHKTKCVIPCSRNISHFKTGRAEVGVLSDCGALWTVEVTG